MSSQDPVARDDAHEDEERDSVPPLPVGLRRGERRAISDSAYKDNDRPIVVRAQTEEATPLIPSMNSIKSIAGYMDPDVKTYLRRHFKRAVVRRYPVAKFIRHVWNFNIDYLRLHMDYQFKLNEKYVEDFLAGKWTKKVEDGKVQREGLAAIAFEHLWQDLASQFTPRAGHTPMTLLDLKDRKVKGEYAQYKPDFGFTPTLSIQEQDWEYLPDCGELKKHGTRHLKAEMRAKLTITKEHIIEAYRISKKRLGPDDDDDDDDTTYEPNRKKTRRTKRDSTVPAVQSTSSALPPATWGEEEGPAELTGSELQMSKYLNEMLSHGARTFASGFLLQECGMTLWYADRMGLVVSESFDIFMQSPLFLLVVAAHHYGQPHEFGLNPLISLPDGTPHLLTYENTILRLPATIPATLPPIDISPDAASAFDEGVAEVVQPVEFRVDLSDGRQILTAYGTIGRGTSVIPVVAGAGAGAHLDGQRLVAKIACPHETRTAEDRFIRIIRRKMNADNHARQYLKNIVDLKCSFSCKMDDEDMGLPRRKMPAVAIELRRCFRVLVMPEYLPLERINSPAELKQIFVDTITGHHWVYETSLILHRDISYGNIMFYRDGSGAGEKVIGVLTDWDLAEQQLDDGTQANESERAIAANLGIALGGKGSSSGVAVSAEAWEEKDMGEQEKNRQKARYRTGTGPFMACDLLSTGLTPKHLYRHDLESFFWVLVWFCVVFNPDKHTLGIISSWHQSSLLYVGAAKREFMDAAKEYNRIFAKTSLEYQPIGTKYIVPLRIRLQRAIDASTIERHATDKWFQALAMQDENRDESLSAAAEDVEWARTRLRDLVTYKHFMDVLNKPL